MPLANLLLSQPLSLDEIDLGLLVSNLESPRQESRLPQAIREIGKQPVTNLNHTLDSERGAALKVSLLDMLSVSPSTRNSLSTSLSSHTFVSYQLRNSDTYFRIACREPAVREFLEMQAQRRFGKAFLVCGFKTLHDAHVKQKQGGNNKIGGGVAAPASVIAGAAAGIPLPIIPPGSDVDVVAVNAELDKKIDETAEFDAPGEQVFAVQFRRVHFAWFSTKKAEGAYLESGNRWKLYGTLRGEGDEDGIEVDLGGVATPSELVDGGDYDSIDLDGEEFVLRIGDGVEEEVTEMRH